MSRFCIRHRVRYLVGTCLVALLDIFTDNLLRAAESPDIARLVTLGKQTQARLSREPAAWTGVHENAVGRTYVKITGVPERRRVIFIDRGVVLATKEPITKEYARVTMRDGFWYVLQNDRASKFRPYEAMFDVPSLNDFLARSELLFPDEETLNRAPFDSQEEGVAYFRLPLSTAMHGLADSAVTRLRKTDEVTGGIGLSAEQRSQLSALEDCLKRGVRLGVDLATGIIVRRGLHGQRIWITNFHWQDAVDENAVAIDGRKWTDETADFDLTNPDDVAMLNHCPIWRPGMTSDVGMTAVLLNVKTGQLRRIPYDRGSAAPGCFSSDRKSVFVMGALGEYGAIGLFEINLRDGSKRRVCDESPDYGGTMFPHLSPDGRTLLAGRSTVLSGKFPLKSQLVLIDMTSGAVNNLSAPMHMGGWSWLPDGSGIIIGRWSLSGENTGQICRLDARSGDVIDLRSGTNPIVLRKTKRILFRAGGNDDRWMTCNLDGSHATLAADGLEGFGFASASPMGDKVLMMRFGGSDGPKPCVVDPVTGKAKSIEVGQGLWAMPAWQ